MPHGDAVNRVVGSNLDENPPLPSSLPGKGAGRRGSSDVVGEDVEQGETRQL